MLFEEADGGNNTRLKGDCFVVKLAAGNSIALFPAELMKRRD